jgi:hypothetical protein
MPKVGVDYSNTIIYKIYCKDEKINDVYVGNTTNFTKRKYQHKICSKNTNDQYYKLKIYKIIRENGGWDNWDMVEIAKYNCKDSAEARIREQEHYEKLKSTLNTVPPYISKQIYECSLCDFKCNKLSNYNKHLSTGKHNVDINVNIFKQEEFETQQKFQCENCGKEYKARNGLWYHNKKCQGLKEPTVAEVFANNNTQQLTELILKMVEQNQELTKQIVELSKTGANIQNNTNNINSHNKFNLNVFLNEECKDAINISDFVSSLVVSVKDLEETARLGYSEGISRIFLNGLQNLDTHARPIHCSDSKREILYIKDENKWEKENIDNDKITKAIKHIASKNMKMIPEWIKEHPDYNDVNSKTNDKYFKLVMNSMSGSTEEEQRKNISKIISNVAKEVAIIK